MDRGEYRSIYTALPDDDGFITLSERAKLVFYTLKTLLGPSGIDVFYLATLEGRGVCPQDAIPPVMAELAAGGWVLVEKNVVWLRNGLKYEPKFSLKNEHHRKSIIEHIRGLPKLAIVNEFARKYELPEPFPEVGRGDATPHATPPAVYPALAKQEKGDRREDINRSLDKVVIPTARAHTHEDEPRDRDQGSFVLQMPDGLERFVADSVEEALLLAAEKYLWMGPVPPGGRTREEERKHLARMLTQKYTSQQISRAMVGVDSLRRRGFFAKTDGTWFVARDQPVTTGILKTMWGDYAVWNQALDECQRLDVETFSTPVSAQRLFEALSQRGVS